MDDPTRLVCPECDLVYRLKRFRPGKRYKCKNCGAALRFMDGEVSADQVVGLDRPAGDDEGARIMDFEAGLADANRYAAYATHDMTGISPAGLDSDMLRQILELARQLDMDGRETRSELIERLRTLEMQLSSLSGEKPSVEAQEGEEQDQEADQALAPFAELAQQFTETATALIERLDAVTIPAPTQTDNAAHQPVETNINIDDLATKLMAGLRMRAPRLDADSGSAVDALARVADELVKEQNTNSARLDNLAGEIRQTITTVGRLEEWRTDLPVQVADEIGRTVEERVVAPISSALARQAPAILSDLQDNKLVEIVSRSVREAQRPLLREILAGAGEVCLSGCLPVFFCRCC